MDLKQLFRKKTIDQILHDTQQEHEDKTSLSRNLNLRDLTAFAIAAIIGAGIFGTIGNASANGGPAVSLLFVFTALACSFSAMAYAEFASKIPISGSAYTYAYASMGELVAWIIGWDLLMEYSVGNIAVAISWSDYLTSFLKGFQIHIPYFLCTDYFGASRGFHQAAGLLASGASPESLTQFQREAYLAWTQAPSVSGIKLIGDVPAFLIVVLITVLVYVGIRESKRTNNVLVLLKVFVIILVVGVGGFYVNPDNWSPFAPHGLSGVMKGVSAVFFAYIGFDAISTTAEECRNPQRDLPRAMIYSLVICTLLYVAITLVLTGMVNYKELAVGDPLSFVFEKVHMPWFSGIIALSAIIAMASVLLVFQLGQPRIWMSMSRDGLLPSKFGKIHPRFRTPAFSTVITGLVVGIPSLFLNLTEVTDLTSIGTLFAFVIVCAGQLNHHKSPNNGSFKMPYVNARYILPLIYVTTVIILIAVHGAGVLRYFDFTQDWDLMKHHVPYLLFFIVSTGLTILTCRNGYSLIPVLGLITNFYLMTELGYTNWLRFLIWLVAGLIIYFSFGFKRSHLRNR